MRIQKQAFVVVAVVLLVVPGLLSAGLFSVRAFASSYNVPAQFQETISAGQFYAVEVDSFTMSTTVSYNVTSDTPITVALMDSSQYSSFYHTKSDISNSIVYQNGTSSYKVEQILPTRNFIVLYAYGASANVSIGYFVSPNTPYSAGQVVAPEPAGIASYGIANDSGNIVSYEIESNTIVGLANISSLRANNPDAGQYDSFVSGATLQLNTELVVNETNGLQDVYWVQNTPDFVTNRNVVSISDNIWNNTDEAGVLTNQSITSTNTGGFVASSGQAGSAEYYYSFAENYIPYNFPFNFALIESSTVEAGVGVLVQLGFREFANGSLVSAPTTDWFDNVTIHVPNVQSAYYEVAGSMTPPSGGYYDSELVFCGEGDGEPTAFTNMSSSLALFYQNGTNQVLSSFPTYYSFGQDTDEAANNLFVTYSNGIVSLVPGTPNYVYLGSSSLTYQSLTLSNTTSTASSITSSVGVSQVATSSTPSESGSTATSQSSAASTTRQGLALNGNSISIVLVIVAIISSVTGLAYLRIERESRASERG